MEIYPIWQKVINMTVILYLSWFQGNSQETLTAYGGHTVQIQKQKFTPCCKLHYTLHYTLHSTYLLTLSVPLLARFYDHYHEDIILIIANKVSFLLLYHIIIFCCDRAKGKSVMERRLVSQLFMHGYHINIWLASSKVCPWFEVGSPAMERCGACVDTGAGQVTWVSSCGKCANHQSSCH